MTNEGKLIPINIEEQMQSAYIDYSMSVIVSRALPDVRDGLKPVHRRVLYGMYELGIKSTGAYKKSARVVGEVLGKYHPHGDGAVYEAMVRMAQDWSVRYMILDGQGNFGSIDGDSPAAMRYTEVRMQKISEEMLSDIEKETVDLKLNFDDTLKEPTVLPSRIPNLLVNGASGIAVGMATNMAPHNLTEVIDGTVAYIDNKDTEINELMNHIKAPDFPTGGIIYGYDGVKDAFKTGRGRIILRGKANIEEIKGRECIVVSEIPYQVNKAEMIKKTAELVNEKKLDGISNIRDESDRNGLRIVYVLKRDAIANIVLNKLFKHTALQTSFSINNIALVRGRPKLLNLKELIGYFVEHRHEVVVRRTEFELKKAEARAHILEGLIIASDHIDEVIQLIKTSNNPEEAKEKLIERFELTEIQAKAIVEMRLRQLTGLEQEKLRAEYEVLIERIKDLKDILDSESRRMGIIKTELLEVKAKFADERRSEIDYAGGNMSIEDMIPNSKVVVTISHAGYIKRTSLSEYKTQNRGGRGQKGVSTRNEDFLESLFVGTNHQYMMFFTQKGKAYWMRVYEVPEGNKTAKGRALQNLINIEPDDKVKAFLVTEDLKDESYINSHYVIMATKKGIVKKTSLEQYSRPRANGINAITIKEGDELLEAKLTTGDSQIMLGVKSGKVVRFEEEKTRPMGRNASGVKGITLADAKDEVIGMVAVNEMDSNILVVSENGYGKRSELEDYRITNRGGKGVKTLNISDKTAMIGATNLQAQKLEKKALKAAEKSLKKGKYDEATDKLASIKDVSLLKIKDRAKYYYVKALLTFKKQDPDKPNLNALDAFEKLSSFEKEKYKKKYSPKISYIKDSLKARFLRVAISTFKSKKFKSASSNFINAYQLSPKDTSFLENAAMAAYQSENYDLAIKNYQKLIDLGYTGIYTTYKGTNVKTGKPMYFPSKSALDLQVKFKMVKDPEVTTTKSKTGDIVKNIAFAYIAKKDDKGALKAIAKAKERFPNDYNLIISEANIYYKLGETKKFLEGLKNAVKIKPDDPLLHYNIGVMAMEEKFMDEAKKSFEKAIELDPKYTDAYLNLANIQISKAEPIVAEMNKNLNNFKKYDALMLKQKNVYKKALPFLLKAHQLNEKHEGTLKTLINIYEVLEMEKERKAMRKKLKAL
uniref:DNA topoisomerase (ATP-hydrolyzing) n=1 Tax=Stylophora pistillata TaxID=50429 RepID=A0A2B4RB82_STYPI